MFLECTPSMREKAAQIIEMRITRRIFVVLDRMGVCMFPLWSFSSCTQSRFLVCCKELFEAQYFYFLPVFRNGESCYIESLEMIANADFFFICIDWCTCTIASVFLPVCSPLLCADI